jgi:hypothetical protein
VNPCFNADHISEGNIETAPNAIAMRSITISRAVNTIKNKLLFGAIVVGIK